jgi:predicted unusual protein kinase regulating ubiquinone biosynthesis (AarF/ABC1/UbiB family)
LKQSQEVVAACKKDRKLSFPEYYPEYSSEKLSMMDWMTECIYLNLKNSDPIVANKVGHYGIFTCIKYIY